MPSKPTYFPALTGLRAVAALAVYAFHQRNAPLPGWPPALAAGLRALGHELYVGVTVFFTLSGFLITYRYAGRRFDAPAWRRYLRQRLARLGPVYWALVLLTFGLYYPLDSLGRPHPGHWLTELLASLTLLKGWAQHWYLTGIAQGWSLTVEAGFYLLAPGLLALGARYGPARAWPALALALLALGLGLYAAVPALGSLRFMARDTLFGQLPAFLAGAAVAWGLRQRAGAPARAGGGRAPAGSTAVGSASAPAGSGRATALGAAGMGLALGLLGLVRVTAGVPISNESWAGIGVAGLLLPLGTAALLRGLCQEPTRLQAVLASGPAQALGRASYCFYLLHMGVVAYALRAALSERLPGWAGPPAQLGLLWLAALALHHGLEQPAYRWLLGRRAR